MRTANATAELYLTLGSQLNAIRDKGGSMPLQGVIDMIQKQKVLPTLERQYAQAPFNLDLSSFDDADRALIHRELDETVERFTSRRELGIEFEGVALLIALCFEKLRAELA